MLSFMTYGSFDAEVAGLDKIPEGDQPPVPVVHYAFQIMVGIGMFLVLLALTVFIAFRKREWFQKKWFLTLFALATPLGFVAVEAGWTVTEVGRQPWILQGILRTKDAVTPMPGIAWTFYLFTAVYISLSLVIVFLLKRQIQMVPRLYDVQPSKKPA